MILPRTPDVTNTWRPLRANALQNGASRFGLQSATDRFVTAFLPIPSLATGFGLPLPLPSPKDSVGITAGTPNLPAGSQGSNGGEGTKAALPFPAVLEDVAAAPDAPPPVPEKPLAVAKLLRQQAQAPKQRPPASAHALPMPVQTVPVLEQTQAAPAQLPNAWTEAYLTLETAGRGDTPAPDQAGVDTTNDLPQDPQSKLQIGSTAEVTGLTTASASDPSASLSTKNVAPEDPLMQASSEEPAQPQDANRAATGTLRGEIGPKVQQDPGQPSPKPPAMPRGKSPHMVPTQLQTREPDNPMSGQHPEAGLPEASTRRGATEAKDAVAKTRPAAPPRPLVAASRVQVSDALQPMPPNVREASPDRVSPRHLAPAFPDTMISQDKVPPDVAAHNPAPKGQPIRILRAPELVSQPAAVSCRLEEFKTPEPAQRAAAPTVPSGAANDSSRRQIPGHVSSPAPDRVQQSSETNTPPADGPSTAGQRTAGRGEVAFTGRMTPIRETGSKDGDSEKAETEAGVLQPILPNDAKSPQPVASQPDLTPRSEVQKPESTAPRPADVRSVPLSDPPKAPPAARDIRLEVNGGERRVEVRLTERAGEVRVAVRTPDDRLAIDLKENLPALSSRLEQAGYRAEMWHGDSLQRLDLRGDIGHFSQGASQDGGRGSGQQSPDRHDRDPRHPREAEEQESRKQKGKEFAWYMSPTH
jgi:hypothetical protein